MTWVGAQVVEIDPRIRALAEEMRGRKVDRVLPLAGGTYTGDGIFRVRFRGEGRPKVLKVIGGELRMRHRAALQVLRDTVEYYRTQREIGIKVAPAEFSLARFQPRQWVLVELAADQGASLERRVARNDRAVESYLEQVLAHIIGPLIASSPDGWHVGPIGFDPLLRNLCFISEHGVPGNIDHVPAKLFRAKDDFTLELPEPTDLLARHLGYVRHYTLAGLLFSLFLNVVRLHPQAYNHVQAQIARFLQRRRRTEILDQIPELVCSTYAFDRKSEFMKMLPTLSKGNLFELRQTAAWAAWRNGRLRPALEKLFRITHFGSNYLTDQEYEAARTHVLAMLQKVE